MGFSLFVQSFLQPLKNKYASKGSPSALVKTVCATIEK